MKISNIKHGLALALTLAIPCVMAADSHAGKAKPTATAASKRILHYKTLVRGSISQSYEIELFDNGDVVYTGRDNVKMVGVVKTRTSRSKAESLINKIWQQFVPTTYAVPDAPTKSTSDERPVSHPPADSGEVIGAQSKNAHDEVRTWHLEVMRQDELRSSSLGVGDPAFDKWLRESIEKVVSTKSFRCPFLTTTEFRLGPRRVLPAGSDLCALQSEWDSFTPSFKTK